MATKTFVDDDGSGNTGTKIDADWANDVDLIAYEIFTTLSASASVIAPAITISDATASTSGTTGAFHTAGGIGAVKDIVTDATFLPLGDTAASDAAAVGYTAAEGLILTGQGSSTDVTIKNDADTTVISIPTGTTGVTFAGSQTVAGAVSVDDTTDSTSGTTGSVHTDGGLGVVKDVVTDATFKPLGDTAASDAAAIGYTATEGIIITGQGSTSDVTIKNDADTTVLSIPTGTSDPKLDGTLLIKEQADASADVAAYGQLWVNTATPNELWFTDDAGTDFKISGTAQIVTGTYTGDGSTSLGVTGVGFAPKYVRIWERNATAGSTIDIWETTAEIMDDDATGGAVEMAGAATQRFQDDGIISLDADGFTVDDNAADTHPNTSGQVYNYMCIG